MLLGRETIEANRALELGLVSQVIVDDDFRAGCLRTVENLLASCERTLPYSRPLFHPYGDELLAFFAKESKLRLQAYNRMGR